MRFNSPKGARNVSFERSDGVDYVNDTKRRCSRVWSADDARPVLVGRRTTVEMAPILSEQPTGDALPALEALAHSRASRGNCHFALNETHPASRSKGDLDDPVAFGAFSRSRYISQRRVAVAHC